MSGGQQLHQLQPLENGNPVSKDDEEIRALELELKEMAQKILHFRSTVPDRLKKAVESSLAAKRPVLPGIDATEAGISADTDLGLRGPLESSGASPSEEDPETAEKVHLLKQKISKNLSTMPAVLKRMHECIAAIDKLDQYDMNIHQAFKRKRTH